MRVPLKDVAANPERWGAKQQLELTAGGHKLTAGGEAAGVVVVLEVQMFLSAVSAYGVREECELTAHETAVDDSVCMCRLSQWIGQWKTQGWSVCMPAAKHCQFGGVM